MAQTHYSEFTVQSGQVPSTQTDFPVLLKPTDNRFKTTGNGGNVAGSSGYDLRPYSDSGLTSALTYELVPGTYSASTGTFEMWVKVPSLSDGYVIYLGYGDTGLSSDGSSTSTWRSEYKGVFHLGDGSSLSVANSSQTSISPTNNGVTATTGKVDGGGAGNGSSQYINLGTVAGLNITGDITLSSWLKTTGTNQSVIGGRSGADGYGLLMGVINNGQIDLFTNNGNVYTSTAQVNDDAWHLVHATLSGSTYTHYTDGGATGTGSAGAPTSYSGDRHLFDEVAGNRFWSGNLDEIRIYSGALTANWITTEWNNQSAPGSFYSIGAEQTFGGTPRRWIFGSNLLP